jgi:hypothetical protein
MNLKVVDGFWLPQSVREQVIFADTEYVYQSFAQGRSCSPEDEGAVTARWPKLGPQEWRAVLDALVEQRQRVPSGEEYWGRLQSALGVVARRFADENDPLRRLALATLPAYTGYSEAMIRYTLGSLDMMTLDQFPAAFAQRPTGSVARCWQPMSGLPGRLRFYGASTWRNIVAGLPGMAGRPLFGPPEPLDMVVGYGAGNVPGTALLIGMMGQSATLGGGAPPIVVVKNSRREPIFSALVFSGLEAVDPDLVSGVAILVWDYKSRPIQDMLLSRASLVIAAASDETIAQIEADMERADGGQRARLHAHGHKVSFSAIGRSWLARGASGEPGTIGSGERMIDVVALLAALDSAYWDQNGCLSARVHFVETGGDESLTADEYAEHLAESLRLLSAFLPRGAWPRQQIRDRFDKYKLLETTGEVQVFSQYDDDYLVAVDRRSLDARRFFDSVNDCQGRVVIVRPIVDLMELPGRYLSMLPAENLQSLSVAVGKAGEGLSADFLRFAEACGDRGITAIRTVGRGAFPQLAYSWDGFIPLDLVGQRPAGRFATIEFDAPYDQILDTYRLLLQRGADMGFGGVGP